METLLKDLRYGARMLLNQPAFTTVAIITLTLGIGANTAIFSLVNAVLLRQLPFNNPEQLVSVWTVDKVVEKSPISIPDFVDFRDQNQLLDKMAAVAGWSANLTGNGDPERLQAVRVSGNLFQMFGVDTIIGRTLLPDDDNPGSQRVVVLSYGLWQRRFGADRNLVGNTLTLNGDSYTVVGILPPDFTFPGSKAELGVPLVIDTQPARKERNTHFLRVFARLKPGVTRQQAQAEMNGIARHLQEQYPETNARKPGARIAALHDEIVGNFRMALLVLLGAVGFVLLIACANLANLLLARATTRHREMAIRAALGATRMRLMRQLLTETILLALVGGVLGLLMAHWGLNLLVALSPADLPRAKEAGIDGRVLGFALGLSLFVGILFGLAPALQASKADLNEGLKGGSRGSTESRRNRVRSLLVVTEVALSLMLLIGAGLFVKSFLRLQEVDPGFNTEKLLVVRVALPRTRYSKTGAVVSFYDQLSSRIETLPGVQSAGAVSIHPLSTSRVSMDFTIDGRPLPSLEEVPAAQYRMVSPSYFRTMNIPVLKGREFTDMDTERTAGVVIINENLARRFWPNENPVGWHLWIKEGDPTPRGVEIVGVVGNVKQFELEGDPTFDLYAPYRQIPEVLASMAANNMSWVVRVGPDPMTLADAVRREAQIVDRDVPASLAGTMEQLVAGSVAPRRFNSFLLGIFAGTALLLALMGIYAVMSYSVTQRTQEIGIRMALGAQQGNVVRLLVAQGLKVIMMGVAVGLVGAIALTAVISSLLFGISAIDPPVFLIISMLFACVALLASYIPARKATKVDPIIALRSE
jgi:predicted permease